MIFYALRGMLIFFSACMPVACLIAQPTWSWARAAGGGNDQAGQSVALDPDGNIFITGYSVGSSVFGSYTISAINAEDIFIAKYNAAGLALWAYGAGGNGDERAKGVATDSAGNAYICGFYEGTINFPGTPGVTLVSVGGDDIFVAKYDPAGNIIWAKSVGGSANDDSRAIAVSHSTVYITGSFKNTFSFGAGTLTSSGGDDVYIMTFDAFSGNEGWAISGGGNGEDIGQSIAVNDSGVFVTGFYADNASFTGLPGILTNAGGDDIFLVKYSLDGVGQWMRRASSSGNDRGLSLTLSGNFLCVGGYFSGTLDIYNSGGSPVSSISSAANEDACLILYNATTGIFSWVRSESGNNSDRCHSVSSSSDGRIFSTGWFTGTLPLPGGSIIAANEDVFVTARDSSGNFLWGKHVAGFNQDIGNAIVALNNTTQYVTGYYKSQPFNFDNLSISGFGSGDVYLAKLECITPVSAGPDQQLCSDSTAMSANLPVSGIGTWSLISGSGNILSVNSPVSTVSNLGTGQNVFAWIVAPGPCPAVSDTVVITVYQAPTISLAGADQQICAALSDSVLINGNNPVTGSGMWSVSSGQGTFTNATQPVTFVYNLGVGLNALTWTISNGVCPASTDTVLITRDPPPTIAAAGPDQQLCNPVSVSMNANTPATGTGSWSVAGGNGNITTPSSPTTTVTALSPGTNVFSWTITSGVCPSSSDSVTILVDPLPTIANAGPDQQICASTVMLEGNPVLSGTGAWSLVSGAGIIAAPSDDSTAVTGLGTGQNIFQWTITNGVCPPSLDQVIIQVDAMPTVADAGNDLQLCDSFVVMNGNIPLTGNGVWSLVSGGGSIANPSTSNTPVTSLFTGVNIFEWVITSGVCPASHDSVAITYTLPPTPANAGADIYACSDSITLGAQIPVTGTGIWTWLPAAGTISNPTDPNASVADLPEGVYLFTWTTSNSYCVSPNDTLLVYIYEQPAPANAGADQLIHVEQTGLTAGAATSGSGYWSVISGSGNFINAANPNTVFSAGVGLNVLTWTVSNGTCLVSVDTVLIERKLLIIPTGISPNGDGKNDFFVIDGLLDFQNVSLEIFNRWGNVIYHSADYNNTWDGSASGGEFLPDDIYYYVLKIPGEEALTGYVVLKRTSL